jgi:NAD-dependent SIR2 family protein deacetylase
MYQFIGRLPISEELKWGYLLTHANKARFNWGPTRLYTQLRQLAESKGDDRYFVKTSNADGFFAQSGFDQSRVFTPQGDYSNMQCLNAEGDRHRRSGAPAVFPTRPFVEAALPHIDTARTMEIVEPKAMPRCPHCGGSVFFNVRGGDWYIETPYQEAGRAYARFLEHALADATTEGKKKKTITILEIGAGFNTPGVLRWPNERLVMQNESVRLVRLNRDHPEVPDTTASSGAIRAVGLPLDAALVVPLFLS